MDIISHDSQDRHQPAASLLSAVLDIIGTIIITCIRSRIARNFPFPPGDFAGAVKFAFERDAEGYDCYFGTSTFKDGTTRAAANVVRVKCCKIDFDIAPEDPRKYRDVQEAREACAAFCEKYRFPQPVMVRSGFGLHAYWIFDTALDVERGKITAQQFKEVTIAADLRTDRTVTGDTARILRVPGTHNYKDPNHPKMVVLESPVATHNTEDFLENLNRVHSEICGKTSSMHPSVGELIPEVAVPAHLRGGHLDDVTQKIAAYKPKRWSVILEKSKVGIGCAQLLDIYENRQMQEEPRWRAILSVVAACEDRDTAIHEVSEGHPGYDYDATVEKAKLTRGPYRCDTFKQGRPDLCNGCPHDGKISSPVQLGGDDLPVAVNDDDSQAITRLAALSPLEYDRVRIHEAKALGIRTTTLDQLVNAARGNAGEEEGDPFPAIEPWPVPVVPAHLLDELAETIERYIVCEGATAVAAALWIALTWFADVVHVLPLASITAPEKRCGKSTLLALMNRLVYRPLTASNITPAALFRCIDKWKPTLLIDEVDAFLGQSDELRGLLNSGHTRDSAFCIRTVGEDHTPTRFTTWCPKALSGIGTLAPTLADRSIVLTLRRKLPNETVERLRYADPAVFEELVSKLARFAQDYADQVRRARPELPAELNDRAQDSYEGLLAIADIAGHHWPQIARAAALSISGEKDGTHSIETELLQDIRDVFAGWPEPYIHSSRLVFELCKDEDKRWATFNRGGAIAPGQIARRLKAFGIQSKNVTVNKQQSKGYVIKEFDDVFQRYLPKPANQIETDDAATQGASPLAA